MKKIILSIFAFSLFPLFAELYPARRYVEVGLSESVMAAQNGMPVFDIFKKHLVIDLKKISSNVGDSGFVFSFEDDSVFNIDLNFKKFGAGLRVESQVDGRLNISKSLFDILGKGLMPGKVYSTDANVWAESFVSIGFPVRFDIGKFRISVKPSVFSPVYYVPSTTVTCYASNGYNGSVVVGAVAPMEVYTVSEFKGLVKDGEISADFADKIQPGSLAGDMALAAGLDLAALVEYPILETLDIGGYINFPIVPARMKHKVYAVATLSVTADSLLNVMTDDSDINHTAEISDAVYLGANYLVNRPLRLGAECAWRPVGKWLTMRASLGLGMRNPFGADFSIKSLYPEYRLGVEIVGIGMFGLSLSTEYTRKVFAHSLGIMLNFRAVEIDVSAAFCSPTFIQSFKGAGVAAACGVKFGW